MKRFIVLFFVSVFILNNSLRELLKMPALISHFNEHRLHDRELDMLEFLSMHYFGNDLDNSDEDRDMQLPFKKMDAENQPTIAAILIGKLYMEKKHVFYNKKKLLFPSYHFNLSDPSANGIFRPPVI